MVLFILAVVWALYLASWLRSRAQGRRNNNSIASFNKHLSVLERARPAGNVQPLRTTAPPRTGVPAAVPSNVSGLVTIGSTMNDRPSPARPLHGPRPMTLAEARKRRRDVLMVLVGFVVFTLAVYLLVGGPTLYLQLLADGLLVAYVGLLANTQRLARERREKVRYLHHDEYAYDDLGYGEPAYAEPAYGEPALVLQRSAN